MRGYEGSARLAVVSSVHRAAVPLLDPSPAKPLLLSYRARLLLTRCLPTFIAAPSPCLLHFSGTLILSSLLCL